jgi:iron complex outermembrane recepter protein
MSAPNTRFLLLSSSALVLLSLAGVAVSQTPPAQTPQAQTPPAQTPQAPQDASPSSQVPPPPETPQTEPTPQPSLPPVDITARRPRTTTPAQRGAAAPAPRPRVQTPVAVPQPTPTPPAAQQPFVPLNAITSGQIQASTSTNFGDLFFTTPGATSAGLAPGVARPILRGLTDFRVRLQENGVTSGDVSDLGQDHAVPIDPLTIQKTEIYRGPAALRFGSQAVGGVVEALNNRIPMYAPPGGVAAEFKAAGTTVNNGGESALLLDAGSRNAAIHADVFGRNVGNYRIPSYPYLFPPDPPPLVNGKQPNSSAHAEGGAVGGSYLFDGGYTGLAIARYASDYHVPTLEGAAIGTHLRLEQTKITSKGEFLPATSAIAAVRYWAGYTDYKHDEIGFTDIGVEAIAATFKKRTSEAKFEVESMPMLTPIGALTGIFGTQFSHQQLDTSGEALLFPARTGTAAAYFFNEMRHTPTLRTQMAGRIEAVNVVGTAVTFPANFLPPPDDPTATPADLTFQPKSIALSVIKDLPSYLVASLTLQRVERAPTASELFSKGPHDATGTFDIGNAGLTIETANSVEIGLKRTDGTFRFDGKAYYTRYDNFIFQAPTGNFCDPEFATCGPTGELLQTFWSQRDAIFRGAELAWQWDVVPLANGIFGLDGQFDTVRATFTDGSNVPRMPPMRVGGGAYWRNDNWFVRMGLLHAFAQTDIAQFETPTDGYNLLRAEIVHRRFLRYSPWGPVEITTGIAGDNLLNVDIRNSTQFHKDEILLPGRNFKFFLNVKYDAEKPSGPPGYYKARKVHGAPPLVYKAAVPWSGWTWAGLYVGANAGASFGGSLVETTFREFATDEPLFGSRPSTRLDGAIFGLQAGYNWTADIWLAGIEGDMQYSRQRGSLTDLCTGDVCNAGLAPLDAPVNVALEHKLGWFGTLRGRFGTTVVPQALAYVTAGVAAAGITIGGTVSGFDDAGTRVSTAFDNRLTRFGWTLGVGLEAQLIGNWTGKLEYLHMDFGSIPTVVPNGTVSTQFNSRISDDVVRVGVNYKFDRIGAVVAKY